MTKLRNALTLVLIIVASFSGAAQQQQQSSASPQGADKAAARTEPVQMGEMAPDFTLEDQQGRKVTLSEARGQSPTILVFYRGNW